MMIYIIEMSGLHGSSDSLAYQVAEQVLAQPGLFYSNLINVTILHVEIVGSLTLLRWLTMAHMYLFSV